MTMLWRCAGLIALALGLMVIVNGCSDDSTSTVFRQSEKVPSAAIGTDSRLKLVLDFSAHPVGVARSLVALAPASTELRSEAAEHNRRLNVGGGETDLLVA